MNLLSRLIKLTTRQTVKLSVHALVHHGNVEVLIVLLVQHVQSIKMEF